MTIVPYPIEKSLAIEETKENDRYTKYVQYEWIDRKYDVDNW